MSKQVHAGRFTADPRGGQVTVFLIGMRANRWWKFGKVARVGAAMPKMLAHLAKTPEAGLLGYQQWFGRTTIMVSYWKSPRICSGSRPTGRRRTLSPGADSCGNPPAPATSAYGTKPTRRCQVAGKACIAICRSSGWQRLPATYRWKRG